MTIVRYTSDDFANQISSGVAIRDKTLDTRIGPYRDVFIDPVSDVLQTQNERIYYVNQLLSLKNASLLVPDDVDDVVINENIVRYQQSSSVTILTFSRVLAPTVDIIIPINFPVSTPSSASTGTPVVFKTIEEVTMYAATASQYYNVSTGNYEITVAIASTSQGSNTTIGAYTITTLQRPFPQFDSIFNTSKTTDGKGIETNSELAKRYSLHVSGSQIGTPTGLESFIVDNFNSVEDTYISYGNDGYMERGEDDPGAVDAWILGSTPLTRTYTTYYNGVYTTNVVDFQPLISVTSVTSAAAAASYVEGVDYEVITGQGVYAYSNRSSDGIRWISGGSHPDIGDDVTIEYSYNSIINQLDAFFKSPDYYHLSSGNLFRWAQPLYVEIEAVLTIKAGSPTNIAVSVREALLNYINSLQLNDNLEEFDMDREVGRIFGVDNFTWTILAVKDGTGVSDIVVGPNQYARIDPADLVITLA